MVLIYFLVACLEFSMYRIMSSADNDSFTSSFPIWIPFLSFSSSPAVTRTSKTMLNKSGKSGHPCLVPHLRRNALTFSPLSMMFIILNVYYVEVCTLYAHFLESSSCKLILNFIKILLYLLRWSYCFYFSIC